MIIMIRITAPPDRVGCGTIQGSRHVSQRQSSQNEGARVVSLQHVRSRQGVHQGGYSAPQRFQTMMRQCLAPHSPALRTAPPIRSSALRNPTLSVTPHGAPSARNARVGISKTRTAFTPLMRHIFTCCLRVGSSLIERKQRGGGVFCPPRGPSPLFGALAST